MVFLKLALKVGVITVIHPLNLLVHIFSDVSKKAGIAFSRVADDVLEDKFTF